MGFSQFWWELYWEMKHRVLKFVLLKGLFSFLKKKSIVLVALLSLYATLFWVVLSTWAIITVN